MNENLKKTSREKAKAIAQKKKSPCDDYNPSNLPPMISGYLQDLRDYNPGGEPIMFVHSILCGISSMIGTRARVRHYAGWLYPNIWCLSISGSGTFKSTVIDSETGGARFAIKYNNSIMQRVSELQAERDDAVINSKQKDKIVAEYKSLIIDEMSKQVIYNLFDSSLQGFQDILEYSRGGMVCDAEFTQFLSMMARNHNTGFKSFLTNAYGVVPYQIRNTRGTGVENRGLIEKPYVTINAASAVQPLVKCLEDTDHSGGFLPRFMMFYPNQDYKKLIVKPPQAVIDEENEFQIHARLMRIIHGKTVEYHVGDNIYSALQTWIDHIKAVVEGCNERHRDQVMKFYYRLPANVLKLCMILQPFMDTDTETISEETLQAAIDFATVSINSTVQLYETELGESEEQAKARKVIEYIAKKGGSCLRRQLISSRLLDGNANCYDEQISTLEAAGEIYTEGTNKAEMTLYLN